jgi:hypothetical protein
MSNKYPEGIQDGSPGSRRDSADHPGIDVLLNPHPERRARNVRYIQDIRALFDPLPGSNSLITKIPRLSGVF